MASTSLCANAVAVVPVLFKKIGLSPEHFSAYWRDVHGVYVSTCKGPSSYRQLHFEPYNYESWPDSELNRTLRPGQALDGVAEFIFADESRRRDWELTIGEFADADDPNLFRRSTSYTVSRQNIQVFKQWDSQSNNDEQSYRLVVMLKAAQSTESLKRYLTESFCPQLAQAPKIRLLQLTTFDPYHVPDWVHAEATGVERAISVEEQRDAMIELAFDDVGAWCETFRDFYQPMGLAFRDEVSVLNAYQVKGAYRLIDSAGITLLGHLGADRARLVRDVSARNIVASLDGLNAKMRNA